MSTHNVGFYEDLTKIIFQLSSNTHLISSSERMEKAGLIPEIDHFIDTDFHKIRLACRLLSHSSF